MATNGERGDPVRYGPTGQQSLIYVEFEGAEAVIRKIGRARGQLTVKSKKMGKEVGNIMVEELQKEAPKGKSGKLAKNIYSRIIEQPNGFTVEAISGMYYTKWVISGRGPVVPIHRQALRWETKSGEVVFAKYAGPTKPNPFHQRAWPKAEAKIYRKWGEVLEDVVAILEE